MPLANTKEDAMANLLALETEIQQLAKAHSLATLDHKLQQRQHALEHLFAQFSAQLNKTDMTLLKDIQSKSQHMLDTMQQTKDDKSDEIIKYKNTGKRIRLYSDIAQQK